MCIHCFHVETFKDVSSILIWVRVSLKSTHSPLTLWIPSNLNWMRSEVDAAVEQEGKLIAFSLHKFMVHLF